MSVIVPCYNSGRTIRQCLRSILSQQTSTPHEIIVVDSSSDETPSIVSEFPLVRLIHLENRARAGLARNIGIRASRGKYCLFIDSDCIASPDVIERMRRRLADCSFSAVGGALRNGTPTSLSGSIGYLIEFREFMPTTPMREVNTSPPANMAFRREVFDLYGYFEEYECSEDLILNWKLTSAGEHILFDPGIEVTHLNRIGWRTVLSYQVDLGRISARARKRVRMSGHVLLRHTSLIALMPFYRLMRAFWWLARHDGKMLMVFLLIWPFYLLAAIFWAFGFWKEAKMSDA